MFLLILEEKRREGEEEGEKHRSFTVVGCVTYAPRLGIETETGACVLTGNQTKDLLEHRTADTQSIEPHWPGLIKKKI